MYLTKEEMNKLTTKRLLAYKKKRLHPGKRPNCGWCTNYLTGLYKNCIEDCGKEHLDELIDFDETYENIIEILNTREHVEIK